MERYPEVAVIEAPFCWDDLGNWSAIPRLQGIDALKNTVQGKHLGINTTQSIIRGEEGHLIVTIGVQNLIIVQTADATFIANRDDESRIKEIVTQLEQQKWDEFL
jgi:mannose-1-phosphate guanylyltransferase